MWKKGMPKDQNYYSEYSESHLRSMDDKLFFIEEIGKSFDVPDILIYYGCASPHLAKTISELLPETYMLIYTKNCFKDLFQEFFKDNNLVQIVYTLNSSIAYECINSINHKAKVLFYSDKSREFYTSDCKYIMNMCDTIVFRDRYIEVGMTDSYMDLSAIMKIIDDNHTLSDYWHTYRGNSYYSGQRINYNVCFIDMISFILGGPIRMDEIKSRLSISTTAFVEISKFKFIKKEIYQLPIYKTISKEVFNYDISPSWNSHIKVIANNPVALHLR